MANKFSLYFCENAVTSNASEQEDILFWQSDIPALKIINGSLDMEINKAGKLELQIPYSHPLKNKIHKRKTRFIVKRGSESIWSGRVLDSEKTFYNSIKITVEGALTYLLDTIQLPYDYDDLKSYAGTKNVNWYHHINYIIDRHNSMCDSDKKFDLDISSSDADKLKSRSIKDTYKSENFQTTKDRVNDVFMETLGGIFLARYDNKKHINKLKFTLSKSGIKKSNMQAIEFGKNMMDFSEKITSENLYTQCIPVGYTFGDIENIRKASYEKDRGSAEPSWEETKDSFGVPYNMPASVDKNQRVTLNTVVNLHYRSKWSVTKKSGVSKIVKNDDDVSRYGKITNAVEFSKVKLEQSILPLHPEGEIPDPDPVIAKCEKIWDNYLKNLEEAAKNWIKKNHLLNTTWTVSAIDLAYIAEGISHLDCGYSIPIISKPHGITNEDDDSEGLNLLCSACTISLTSPTENQYTIGATSKALTDRSVANKETSGKHYGLTKDNYTL